MRTASFLALTLFACGPASEAPKAPAATSVPPASTPAAPAKGLVKSTPSADYPLKTCVVSGEELGAMGDRVAYRYDGREVQFCCPDCIAKFEKEPEKYLEKIEAARK